MSRPTLASAVVTGGLSGALAAVILTRRGRVAEPSRRRDEARLDGWIARDIMEASREVASDLGRPEVANVVARRLLNARRQAR